MEDPAEKVDRLDRLLRWWGMEIPGQLSPSETRVSVEMSKKPKLMDPMLCLNGLRVTTVSRKLESC